MTVKLPFKFVQHFHVCSVDAPDYFEICQGRPFDQGQERCRWKRQGQGQGNPYRMLKPGSLLTRTFVYEIVFQEIDEPTSVGHEDKENQDVNSGPPPTEQEDQGLAANPEPVPEPVPEAVATSVDVNGSANVPVAGVSKKKRRAKAKKKSSSKQRNESYAFFLFKVLKQVRSNSKDLLLYSLGHVSGSSRRWNLQESHVGHELVLQRHVRAPRSRSFSVRSSA